MRKFLKAVLAGLIALIECLCGNPKTPKAWDYARGDK